MELDSEERHVVIPEDLKEAFISQPLTKDVFEKLSNSHKKEYVNWILSAKQEDTRQRRIEKTLKLLLQGKNLRSHPANE